MKFQSNPQSYCFYVSFTPSEARAFNAQWPGAGIPKRNAWFQFEKRNGDLVDLHPCLCAPKFDGDECALNALSQTACKFGLEALRVEQLGLRKGKLPTECPRSGELSANQILAIFYPSP